MKLINGKVPFLKIFGGIGTIIGVFIGLSNLYNWYDEKTISDISGTWKMNYVIETTSFNPYKGLKLGYLIFIEQNGSTISGSGDKISENNQVLTTSARTPIELKGTFDGKSILLSVKEKGKRRETSGMIKLQFKKNSNTFKGIFNTTAANSSGKCIVELTK